VTIKETIVSNEEIQKAFGLFMKVTTFGAIIIGTALILNKVLDFTFDISVSMGL